MNLTSLTAAGFKKIVGLLERKEALLAQVASIDAELMAYEGDQPGTPARGRAGAQAQPRPRKAKPAQRGAVKTAILDLLRGAGKSGLAVQEIVAKLGSKYSRVSTWFSTTGKTIKEVQKVGPGKYAWAGAGAPVPQPATARPVSKPAAASKPTAARPASKPAKPAQAKGGKPAVTKEGVIELLKSAGKAGITVKDMAAKLGVNMQRLYVWFSGTGKQMKQINKVAPAKYAWLD